jgi:hypothetical protein
VDLESSTADHRIFTRIFRGTHETQPESWRTERRPEHEADSEDDDL